MDNDKNMWKLKQKIQAYFLTGLLIVLPLIISVTVLSWIFVQLSDAVFPLLPLPKMALLETATLRIWFRGIALLILFASVSTVGFIATNVLGNKLLNFGENLLIKIPLFNKIYIIVKQISKAFLSSKNLIFKEAVIFEYPRKGIYSIGFASGEASPQLFTNLNGQKFINVFIPTVPNPTSGFYILVPKEEITVLNISTEDAFKLIISGGIVLPHHIAQTQKLQSETKKEF